MGVGPFQGLPASGNAGNIPTKSVTIRNGDSMERPGRDGQGPDESKPLCRGEQPLITAVLGMKTCPADLHLRAVSHGFSKWDCEDGESV